MPQRNKSSVILKAILLVLITSFWPICYLRLSAFRKTGASDLTFFPVTNLYGERLFV